MDMRQLIFWSTVLVFLLSSCNWNRGKYFEIHDDLEVLALKEDNYVSQVSNLKAGSVNQLSDQEARSGQYSIRLDSTAPFGMNFKLHRVATDEFVRMDVSYKGPGSLVLVAQGDDPDVYYRKSVSPPDTGSEWTSLSLEISIPPTMDGQDISLYVWNADGLGVWVDDFSLTYEASRGFPSYDPEETVHIYIDSLSLLALDRKRSEAFQTGILMTEEDDYVDGIMYYKDTIMPIELRLKGDWLDHLEGRKWSFRVKVRQEFTWQRMKTFSLHTPLARNFLDEWVAHELFRQNGLLATRYGFVPVTLNGKSLGLYAWEEHFEKQLVEYSNRREGPILKLDESHFWKIQEHYLQGGAYPITPVLQAADIMPFKEGRTQASPLLYNQFLIARDLVNQYRFRQEPPSEVFHTSRLAGYLALVDLTRGFHAMNWHNQRFYYDPVLSQLEPVFFDAYTELGVYNDQRDPISAMIYPDRDQPQRFEDLFWFQLYEDYDLLSSYYQQLVFFTDDARISRFMDSVRQELENYESLIRQEFEDYRYNPDFLAGNAEQIRAFLPELALYLETFDRRGGPEQLNNFRLTPYDTQLPAELVKDYVQVFRQDSTDAGLRLEAINYHPLMVEVLGTSALPGAQEQVFDQALELPAYEGTISQPDAVSLTAPANTRYVWCRVANQAEIFVLPLVPFRVPSEETVRQELVRSYAMDLPEGGRLSGTDIVFSGKLLMQTPLVIPKGYRLVLEAGTTLDMRQESFLLSYSPVWSKGTPEQPVEVTSGDSTSMGFHIFQAPGSRLEHTAFTRLNTLDYRGWVLTGAVNFYESDVEIDQCTFADNLCEDALNIIRSHFSVTRSFFSNTFADAFDSDFCTGTVYDTRFTDIGNDAIDFSGSQVDIASCLITRAGDKGVSCGEQSILNVSDTRVEQAIMAYASKDYSQLNLENCTADQVTYGLVAYQKKPEYGPGFIHARRFDIGQADTLHLVEIASRVRINSSVVNGQHSQLALRFY